METMRRMIGPRPLGIWVALFCILFSLVAGNGGQILSLMDWDLALRLGLQENAFDDPNPVERALAHIEWGTCAADALLAFPLFVLGFVGLACRRRWGVISALMGASVWVYYFLLYSLSRWSLASRGGLAEWGRFVPSIAAFSLVGLLPSLLVFWGLAANLDRFAPARSHSHVVRRKTDGLPPSRLEDFLISAGQVLRTIPQVWIGKRLNWGARREDVECRLAADAFFTGRPTNLDRAITIGRPPEEVWPWVARFGRGAGYFSWDFLDNSGYHHADYLIDAPEPALGDRNDGIGALRHLEVGREIAWYDESDSFKRILGTKSPFSLTFRLDPAPDGGTRLHFRTSLLVPATRAGRVVERIVILMDHVMSTEMLRRLKVLVESYEDRLRGGETNEHMAPHEKPGEFHPAL